MEKINFINNQAPALNATNLNQLQTNIENELINIYANAGDNVELKLNILNMLNGFRY